MKKRTILPEESNFQNCKIYFLSRELDETQKFLKAFDKLISTNPGEGFKKRNSLTQFLRKLCWIFQSVLNAMKDVFEHHERGVVFETTILRLVDSCEKLNNHISQSPNTTNMFDVSQFASLENGYNY